jgi:hypothetical protein
MRGPEQSLEQGFVERVAQKVPHVAPLGDGTVNGVISSSLKSLI